MSALVPPRGPALRPGIEDLPVTGTVHEIDERADEQPPPLITDILSLKQLEVDIVGGPGTRARPHLPS